MGTKVNYRGASKVTRRLCDINNENTMDEQLEQLVSATKLLTDTVSSLAGAAMYSPLLTYRAGDHARYEMKIYQCKTDIEEPEVWTPAHWTQMEDVQAKINTIVAMLNSIG